MKHVNIKVIGKVQGVFFRASTRSKADDLGVKGFVRNEPDGSVYIEAEGTEEQLNRLVEWCKEGPPSARVDALETNEATLIGYNQFNIQK